MRRQRSGGKKKRGMLESLQHIVEREGIEAHHRLAIVKGGKKERGVDLAAGKAREDASRSEGGKEGGRHCSLPLPQIA